MTWLAPSARTYLTVSVGVGERHRRATLKVRKHERDLRQGAELLGGGDAPRGRRAASDQGLTLVHFSAQPEPFLRQNTP
jgi:hypothetical protein